MSEHPRIARVRPDSRVPQLDREFDYRIPPGMSVVPGQRVRVPMGRGSRVSSGIVTAVVEQSDYAGKLGDIEDVVSEVVVVPPELARLAEDVALRSGGGVSDILRLAVPARAVRVEKAWLEREAATRVRPRPLEWSNPYPEDAWTALGTRGSRTWCELPYSLAESGVLSSDVVVAQRAAQTLISGESAIVVVPDWRDIARIRPLLENLVGEEFVACFDNEDTPSERYRTYLRCLEDDPVVVLGSRHSIYTPVTNLGLIIVHFDGDSAHREPLAPYPHTRDIALIRAEQSGAALCFSSLVPSIAVQRLRGMGYLASCRPTDQTRPRVIPTSLTLNADGGPNHARLPSMAFKAVTQALKMGPVLVQVHRSGFSPGLACRECGERARCVTCEGPLTSVDGRSSLQCRWCGEITARWACGVCRSVATRPVGHGVGRTVSELGKAFPGVLVIHADGDHPVTTVSDTPALVVATRGAEPVAARGYSAVLLLDGQSMLQRPALNALTETVEGWEWALSLTKADTPVYLTDVDGPVVGAFASGMYVDTLNRELAHRVELGLPPAVKMVVVEADAQTIEQVLEGLKKAVPAVTWLGPVAGAGMSQKVLIKTSYHDSPLVAGELRAMVVAHSVSRRKGASRMKVSFDAQSALDEFGHDAQ